MTSKPKVYLAGPIAGLDFKGATDWRNQVSYELRTSGIDALSPMRAKDYLAGVASFAKDCDLYAAENVLSSNRGILTRDFFDCARCDVLFINFLGATAVSIGTCFEAAWGYLLRKPIVLVIEPEGNIHEHGMLKEMTGYRLQTLEQAVNTTKAILLS